MDTNRIIHIGIFVLAIFFVVAQAAPKSLKQLMDEALEKRLNDYTRVVERKCASDIKKRAEEIVDSILLSEAQVKTVDTFKRPPVPTKPERPQVIPPKDSTEIKPLFEK